MVGQIILITFLNIRVGFKDNCLVKHDKFLLRLLDLSLFYKRICLTYDELINNLITQINT